MLLEMFLIGRMWTDATFSGTQETYIKLAKSNGFLFFLRLLRFHSSIWERIGIIFLKMKSSLVKSFAAVAWRRAKLSRSGGKSSAKQN